MPYRQTMHPQKNSTTELDIREDPPSIRNHTTPSHPQDTPSSIPVFDSATSLPPNPFRSPAVLLPITILLNAPRHQPGACPCQMSKPAPSGTNLSQTNPSASPSVRQQRHCGSRYTLAAEAGESRRPSNLPVSKENSSVFAQVVLGFINSKGRKENDSLGFGRRQL